GASLSNLKMILAQSVEALPGKTAYKPLIDNIITTVRNISHSLSPPGLALFGLENTLHELFDNFNAGGTLKLVFENELGEKLDGLPGQTPLALYRIIQELLANTIKHADAKNVLIRCFTENDNYVITYLDDGKGIGANQKNGMGMQNIEARLRMIAGYSEMPVTSKGFLFKIIIPVNPGLTI
ncbi:MAG TPA: ATP-binding protein, partial [Ferruginibacter sp.]|nr:ATP-binding protein [Ferruginibacter sp.]